MEFTSINKLRENALYWTGLILYDDIYNMVHFDESKQADTFKQIVIDTMREYEKFYPAQFFRRRLPLLSIQKPYTFTSNWQSYLEGKITEEDVELIPEGIYYIKSWGNTSAQWWFFDKKSKTITSRIFAGMGLTVSYFANRPMVWEKDETGNWSENSGIYYLGIDDDSVFRRFFSFYLLRHIRNVNMSHTLNQTVDFLKNIDNMVSEAKEEMETMIKTRSDIYMMWRK